MLKGETFAVVVRLLKESGCKFLGVDSENGTPGFVAVNINSPAPPIAALTPTPVIFETSLICIESAVSFALAETENVMPSIRTLYLSFVAILPPPLKVLS